jgi:hypothetical protein
MFVENPDRCRIRNAALSLKAFFEALVLGRMWTVLTADGRTVKSYKELVMVYSATKMPSLGLTQTDLLCFGLASIPGGLPRPRIENLPNPDQFHEFDKRKIHRIWKSLQLYLDLYDPVSLESYQRYYRIAMPDMGWG